MNTFFLQRQYNATQRPRSMQSIPPRVSARPEIEEAIEPPLKKRRKDKSDSTHLLIPEIFVHITKYLNPKSIYCGLALTNKVFFEWAPLIFTHAYDPWWKNVVQEEFPDSYASFPKEILESEYTEWHQIYRKECLLRKNIVVGKYTKIRGDFIPHLNSLHQSENLYVTHSSFSIDGWSLRSDKIFSLTGAFASCTTYQNMLFTFSGDNSIQVYKVPSEAERSFQRLPLSSLEAFEGITFYSTPLPPNTVNSSPVKEAKVQWPFLLGFAKTETFLWNLHEKPAAQRTFTVTKLNFIGLWDKEILYIQDEKILSQNIESLTQISLFDLSPYHFTNIHMDGPRIICWLSKHQNKRTKHLLLIDLLHETQALIPFNFSYKALTFIYDAHFYWCDANLKVLGALSLDTLTKIRRLSLVEKEWILKKEVQKEIDSEGLEFKLMNGLVHTRVSVSNLANNVLSNIGGTLCQHARLALDYSKVVYLNGYIVRGYPCNNNDENNIEIFNFNPQPQPISAPAAIDASTDAMDVS